jgi:hypothetical protein
MRKLFALLLVVYTLAITMTVEFYAARAGEDRGRQVIDNYVDKSDHSRDKVKFHLALELMSRSWTEDQKQLILEAINAPTKAIETRLAAAFTRDDAISVFYNIGSVDISDLRTIYATPIGKSAIVKEWPAERKIALWRMNFALGFVRYNLNPEQQQFLIELSEALPGITRDNVGPWNDRALKLFEKPVGRGLLTTVGDDRCPGQFAALGKPVILPNCVCTTHAGNWSCNDACQGEGSCSVVLGDCGVLWLYDCNGMCDNQEA